MGAVLIFLLTVLYKWWLPFLIDLLFINELTGLKPGMRIGLSSIMVCSFIIAPGAFSFTTIIAVAKSILPVSMWGLVWSSFAFFLQFGSLQVYYFLFLGSYESSLSLQSSSYSEGVIINFLCSVSIGVSILWSSKLEYALLFLTYNFVMNPGLAELTQFYRLLDNSIIFHLIKSFKFRI